MRLLIIGGTQFLGRHLVETARARGHTLTLFNRGKTNPGLFEDVEEIHGDRSKDLQLLESGSWDAVIDTCGYFPKIVAASSRALKGRVGRYCFISSISVYADVSKPGVDESAPVGELTDPDTEEMTGETYGPLKAGCEAVVLHDFGDAGLIVRPGLIVGPYDPTDRFTYWPVRIASGGTVVVPEPKDAPVQIIDCADLAEWTLDLLEKEVGGVFNATGPQTPLTMAEVIDTCLEVSGSDADIAWVPPEFLLENEVAPWSELPLWLPSTDGNGEMDGMMRIDVSKAVGAGLTFRPIRETVASTLEWAGTLPADRKLRAGLDPEKERQLLDKLGART